VCNKSEDSSASAWRLSLVNDCKRASGSHVWWSNHDCTSDK